METSSKKYKIVFSFFYDGLLERYIPKPVIVSVRNDKPYMMAAPATSETLKNYHLKDLEDGVKKGMEISEKLSIDALEKKYCTLKRSENSLEKLFSIKEIKKSILKYYDLLFNSFVELSLSSSLELAYHIKRKDFLDDKMIITGDWKVKPVFDFAKTPDGIDYTLRLKVGEEEGIYPADHDVKILGFSPGWVLIDRVLMRLEEVSGHKIKPFLKNKTMHIPKRAEVQYFERFILGISNRLEISTSGFEVITKNLLQQTKLSIGWSSEGKHFVKVKFCYPGADFNWNSDLDNRSRLSIQNEDISIIKVERQRQLEKEKINLLISLGLTPYKFGGFVSSDEDDYGFVDILRRKKKVLEDAGFQLEKMMIDGKALSLDGYDFEIIPDQKPDWFDLRGRLEVGGFLLAITQLFRHIKNHNRLFELPDGRIFVIPHEMFTRYKEIAEHMDDTGDHPRIRKNLYTLLDDATQENDRNQSTEIIKPEDIDLEIPPDMNVDLRPYQEDGVKWLMSLRKNGFGGCLADDMGLGKTVQIIALLSIVKRKLLPADNPTVVQLNLFEAVPLVRARPLTALVVMPSSLLFNWKEEFQKFNPSMKVYTHMGPKRLKHSVQIQVFDVVLTSYMTALKDIDILRSIDWEYVILDESQMIKNRKSKVFLSLNKLQAKNKISLSGTPIENSLSDLWSQMQFVNSGLLGDFKSFDQAYIKPISRHRDEKALRTLVKIIKPYILRRTKEEVSKDLPPVYDQRIVIAPGINQRKIYDRHLNGVRNFLLGLDDSKGEYRMHVFSQLTKLRLLANTPALIDDAYQGNDDKIDIVFEQMRGIVNSGHKILAFSSFTKLLDLYLDRALCSGIKCFSLTGKDSAKKREKTVHDFQQSTQASVFFISLKAGGTGLNLTAADYVMILDPWWNPFAEEQALARAHRIGQKNPVTVLRYYAADTIEEKILKLQQDKKHIADAVINLDENGVIPDINALKGLVFST